MLLTVTANTFVTEICPYEYFIIYAQKKQVKIKRTRKMSSLMFMLFLFPFPYSFPSLLPLPKNVKYSHRLYF